MAAREVYFYEGVEIRVFEKSIQVVGVPSFIYYARRVTKDDVQQIAAILAMGQRIQNSRLQAFVSETPVNHPFSENRLGTLLKG